MSVLVVSCLDYSIKSFSNLVIQEIAVHKQKSGVCVVSAEEARLKRKNSIVLGRLFAIPSTSNESQPLVVLFREVLCNGTYGKPFTAIIHNKVRIDFMNLKPKCHDLVAFFEPFVFRNPALPKDNLEELPLHILEIGDSLVIYGEKIMLSPQNKISLEIQGKNINSDEKNLTSNSKHSNGNGLLMQDDHKTQTRRKPSIQLPDNPQIPGNTKRLNPQYKYTTIKHVKSSANSGNLERANMFVVVKEVTKTVSRTSSGKFTIICKVIDDSINKKEITCDTLNKKLVFSIHFFTADDLIIKQIEQMDILRLHRVQIEAFNDDADGRVFNSHDIMIFKANSSDIRPVTVAKKSVFTDDDKKRVKQLRNWLNDINGTVLLLKNIRQEGVFNVNCKVITKINNIQGDVSLKVSDGSDTSHFLISFPLKRTRGNQSPIKNGTIIDVLKVKEKFSKIISGDFINLKVNASFSNGPKLFLHNLSAPFYLDRTSNEFLELKKKTECNEAMNTTDHTELQTSLPDFNSDQCITNSTCPSDNHQKPACENERNVNEEYLLNKEDLNNGSKPRKALFSANYGDLSDATEEDTMENLEVLKNIDGNQMNQLKVDVTPANTNFDELINLVKEKYCAPRKLSSIEGDPLESPLHKTKNLIGDINENPKLSELVSSVTRFRKRILKEPEVINVEESMDDDRTVINLAIQNAHNIEGVTNKKIRLESKSAAIDEELINIPCSSELSSKNTSDSVINWLTHPNNKHENIRNLAETEEIDVREIIQLLYDEHCKTTDFSHYLNSNISRCQLFLIEVVPDPSKEPLDLVSGFCNMGCQKFFLFSTINWDFNGESIAFCPFCMNINQERELELLFLIEFHVMTTLGLHDTVIACRENAEVFLGCTAREFLTDSAVRMSRVQMLNDYTLLNTKNTSRTPLMDISVILKGQILCLVNSKLKHPPYV